MRSMVGMRDIFRILFLRVEIFLQQKTVLSAEIMNDTLTGTPRYGEETPQEKWMAGEVERKLHIVRASILLYGISRSTAVAYLMFS